MENEIETIRDGFGNPIKYIAISRHGEKTYSGDGPTEDAARLDLLSTMATDNVKEAQRELLDMLEPPFQHANGQPCHGCQSCFAEHMPEEP